MELSVHIANLTLIMSMIMCLQNMVSISLFFLKLLNKKRILTSIKGCNAVAKLRKITYYNPKVDLVNNNNIYTKKLVCSQDVEEKLNSDINQGP